MHDDRPSYKREHLVPIRQAERRGMDVTTDPVGYINSARVPHPFLIDLLLEREMITHEHHFHAMQFLMMRRLFLKDVSVRVGMLRIKSDGDEPGTAATPIPMEDTDYLRVIRGMRNQKQKEVVMAVCMEEADAERLYPQLERMEATVHMAFGNLADIVKDLVSKRRCRILCGEECVDACK